MRKLFLLLFTTGITLLSCKNNETKEVKKAETAVPAVPVDSTLITDSSWGLIYRHHNIDSLKKIYGAANLKDQRICGAECADSVDVTILYPDTEKETIIYWHDTAYHKIITMIESYPENTPWHTSFGMKKGSSMKQLLEVNKNKITFSGFGWDYGGYVQSYNDGALSKTKISYRFDLMEGEDALYGDRELNTDMPMVKKALDKILVSSITLDFTKPE